jgi:hypothetical protein
MTAQQNPAEKYRFERKFYVSDLTFAEVESVVRLNPGLFHEIFHPRWVNNIYFDSPEMDSFLDNVAGAMFRSKVRIRWYGDLRGGSQQPTIEFKKKCGLLGSKESYPLAPFAIGEDFSRSRIRELLHSSLLPEFLCARLACAEPSLLNRYRRKYFRSVDERYRITLDDRQQFFEVSPLPGLRKLWTNDSDVILELKYAQEDDDDASRITNHFPFRLTKSSKYVRGIEVIQP